MPSKSLVRFIASLLVLVMVLTSMPAVSFASDHRDPPTRNNDYSASTIDNANNTANVLLGISLALVVVGLIVVLARRKPPTTKKTVAPPAPADTTSGYFMPSGGPTWGPASDRSSPTIGGGAHTLGNSCDGAYSLLVFDHTEWMRAAMGGSPTAAVR